MDLYSRDRTVAAITKYYRLLVSMYLHHDDLVFPPAGGDGWPHITQENLAKLNKTDDVIDLLRHLPYVKPVDRCETTQIYPWTVCSDYFNYGKEDEYGPYTRYCDESDFVEFALLPPHIITIARPVEADGDYFFLDTKRNVCTIMNSDGGGPIFEGYENFAQDDVDWAHEEKWRAEPTYLIPDCFEGLSSWLRTLPDYAPSNQVEWHGWEEGKKIFRDHGWPTPAYDKVACLRALRKISRPEYEGKHNFPTLDELDAKFPDLVVVEDSLPKL